MRHFILLITLMLTCTQTQAHLLKVFAYSKNVEGNKQLINGKVYFTGGEPVNGTPITFTNSAGKAVHKTTTNDLGKFTVSLTRDNYKIVADTQDGHKAIWHIKAQPNNGANTTKNSLLPLGTSTDHSMGQLEQMIAAQISEQIAPLTEQIIKLQEKRQLQDIIGAVGYILGVFGLFLWFKQRHLPVSVKRRS